ncbi:MAG TPA: NAD(P)/FAD-dependent oxidoreductase, partial [Chloroflexota bacterium]|nr:NAD(P)/FAD-dependent oxidoreductase [Chloroflexota bacterium]
DDEGRVPIPSNRPRVVVVGAGFGGLSVVRGLSGAAADVLVVDRHNYHTFQPLLYQVATAGLEPEDIAHPIRRNLRGFRNVSFRLATVAGVDLANKRLQTDVGPITYDFLVLAAGSQTNYFGVSLAEKAFGLKDLSEAIDLRNHLLVCYERALDETDPARRQALLTFVIAGGGPTGVELAGALAELTRVVLARDYPEVDVNDTRVILVEGLTTLITTFDPKLQAVAIRELGKKGVKVKLGAQIKSYDGRTIHLSDGSVIQSRTLVWAAGVRAADLGSTLGMTLTRGGRVPVEATLQVIGHPDVYVVGDLAGFDALGQQLPMVAPVAIQQGAHVANNLRRQLAGRPLLNFAYRDRGSMATIGRNEAVAQIGRFRFTGFPAWIVWLTLHLVQIISVRNRILILVNWIWDYLFFDRAVRLITRDRPTSL